MQELAQMEYPLGMPIAWLFDTDGIMLKDSDDRPLTRYLTEFEYVYDEEEDDRCDMTFQFDSIDKYDLPYLTHDVIILVQWGFVTPGGEVIKSPQRKVAIRDITTSYSNKGFVMNIKCTDLVAYLKAYSSRAVRVGGGLIAKLENYFLQWLKEIANGQFTATITNDKKSIHYNYDGDATVSDYDPELNRMVNPVKDETAIGKKFYYELYAAKTIKGKSKSTDNAIRDQLEAMEGISNGQPSKLMLDGTDDNISIRTRNFDQNIFKIFVWQGGLRNLIDFKNKTNTRLVEEDKATTSDINPFNKESEATQVNYADEEDKKPVDPNRVLTYQEVLKEIDAEIEGNKTIREDFKQGESYIVKIKPEGKEIKEERIILKETLKEERVRKQDSLNNDGFVNQLAEKFKHNIEEPTNQQEPGKLTYSQEIDDRAAPKGKELKGIVKFKIEASMALCQPGFEEAVERRENFIDKKTRALFNKGIEKIQRKHEATATVMGDPSLTKARTYGFFGLSNKDSGKWYCTTVSHKISSGNGYICSMELLKAPKNISMAELKFKEKRSYLTTEELIELNRYISSEIKVVAKGTGELTPEELNSFKVDTVKGINDRVEILKAEDDYKSNQ